jgi:hypothetical protein
MTGKQVFWSMITVFCNVIACSVAYTYTHTLSGTSEHTYETAVFTVITVGTSHLPSRGATIKAARSLGCLTVAWQHPINTDPQYGTCFRHLQFWGGKFVHPQPKVSLIMIYIYLFYSSEEIQQHNYCGGLYLVEAGKTQIHWNYWYHC